MCIFCVIFHLQIFHKCIKIHATTYNTVVALMKFQNALDDTHSVYVKVLY